MDAFFYVTGAVFWTVVAGFIFYCALELGAVLCVAIDHMRWQIATYKEHAVPWTYRKLPKAVWVNWMYFLTHGTRSTTVTSRYGWWKGFRNWGVHKRSDAGPA